MRDMRETQDLQPQALKAAMFLWTKSRKLLKTHINCCTCYHTAAGKLHLNLPGADSYLDLHSVAQ